MTLKVPWMFPECLLSWWGYCAGHVVTRGEYGDLLLGFLVLVTPVLGTHVDKLYSAHLNLITSKFNSITRKMNWFICTLSIIIKQLLKWIIFIIALITTLYYCALALSLSASYRWGLTGIHLNSYWTFPECSLNVPRLFPDSHRRPNCVAMMSETRFNGKRRRSTGPRWREIQNWT
jgi:hypothetical protein